MTAVPAPLRGGDTAPSALPLLHLFCSFPPTTTPSHTTHPQQTKPPFPSRPGCLPQRARVPSYQVCRPGLGPAAASRGTGWCKAQPPAPLPPNKTTRVQGHQVLRPHLATVQELQSHIRVSTCSALSSRSCRYAGLTKAAGPQVTLHLGSSLLQSLVLSWQDPVHRYSLSCRSAALARAAESISIPVVQRRKCPCRVGNIL